MYVCISACVCACTLLFILLFCLFLFVGFIYIWMFFNAIPAGNQIGYVGYKAIGSMLLLNKGLTFLALGWTRFGTAACSTTFSSVSSRPFFRFLFSARMATHFFTRLQRLTESLADDEFMITNDELRELARGLEGNATLLTLTLRCLH